MSVVLYLLLLIGIWFVYFAIQNTTIEILETNDKLGNTVSDFVFKFDGVLFEETCLSNLIWEQT